MVAFVPEALTRGSITVRDGRRVSYAEYGTDGGDPVLFVPGAASGALMAFGGALLDQRDIRLISFDRPGLGASDADPAKSFDSVGADIRELVDTLVGHPVPVVANSQGAPFGIAAAASGAASRLVLASPSDEVAFPSVTAQLPSDFQQFIGTVRDATPVEAVRMFTSFTAATFFDMVMAEPVPADTAVYLDSTFRDRFRRVVEEGFAQGSLGYAQDTALAMSAWGLHLSAVNVPVHILFGSEDRTHSPDLGETLAARFANASRTVVPQAGGSLLWARPELVIDLCA